MEKSEVLLESYALQKDLRIRLPKQILSNMPVDIGTLFNIYFNPVTNEIILRVAVDSTSAATKSELGEAKLNLMTFTMLPANT